MIPLRGAVVGAGPVGRALARAWQQSGDTVVLAVRNPVVCRAFTTVGWENFSGGGLGRRLAIQILGTGRTAQ